MISLRVIQKVHKLPLRFLETVWKLHFGGERLIFLFWCDTHRYSTKITAQSSKLLSSEPTILTALVSPVWTVNSECLENRTQWAPRRAPPPPGSQQVVHSGNSSPHGRWWGRGCVWGHGCAWGCAWGRGSLAGVHVRTAPSRAFPGIVLDPQITMGSVALFSLLSLLNHESDVCLHLCRSVPNFYRWILFLFFGAQLIIFLAFIPRDLIFWCYDGNPE